MYRAILISLILHACTKKDESQIQIARVDKKYIVITAGENMNNNSALIVDIVQVYEGYLWNELIKLTQTEYFQRRKWIVPKNVKIWSIEVTQDFWSKGFYLADYANKCVGTILFASYRGTQSDKIKLDAAFDCTIIGCGEQQITQANSANIIINDAISISPYSA